jgi:hypothetical protein
MAIAYRKQRPPSNIEHHYTPEPLARRLVRLVPVGPDDVVLDPAAGKTRIFVKSIAARRILYCEVDEGMDFMSHSLDYDWAITNPPYHLLWKFIDKTSQEARKGFAFLVNINGINTLTPKRLALLEQRRFHMRSLHVCNVKQWMGRYYFYVFRRDVGAIQLSWDLQSWQ